MGRTTPGIRSQDVTLKAANGSEVPVAVERIGHGRPVCFLHGLIGQNEHWHPVLEGIQGAFESILLQIPLLDLDRDTSSVSGVMSLVDAYLREHVDETVVLVGSSFGGHVAARFTLEYPDRVAALVLTGSSGAMERDVLGSSPVHRRNREWLTSRVADLFHDERFVKDSDIDRVQTALASRAGARSFLWLSRSALNDYLGSELGEIHCPTLLVWGRQDAVTPPAAAEVFHQGISGSQLVWIDECGHAPMVEKPRELSEALAKFITSLD